MRLTTLPPFCAIVIKSGNLNFLETSGPPQASNGTALPLLFEFIVPKIEIFCSRRFAFSSCSKNSLSIEFNRKCTTIVAIFTVCVRHTAP